MPESIYKTKEYLEQNPTWHEKDSPWKTTQIRRVLTSDFLDKNFSDKRISIFDIGAGVGTVLGLLKDALQEQDYLVDATGIDPSPDAIKTAQEKWPQLRFENISIQEVEKSYDVCMLIDVIEHVDDPADFIQETRKHASYILLHIPLDENLNIKLRNRYQHLRDTVGHIHYYDTSKALKLLRDQDLEVLDYVYTKPYEVSWNTKTLKNKIALYPRKLLSAVSPRASAKLLGGMSMMVLTKVSTTKEA